MARFRRNHPGFFTACLLLAVLFVALVSSPVRAFARHANPKPPSSSQSSSSQQALPPLLPPNAIPPAQSAPPNVRMVVLPPQELAFIGMLENSLYGVRYDQDPVTARLDRIEQTVFGQTRDQMSLTDRLGLLHQTISNAQQATPPQPAPPQTANMQPQQQPGFYAPAQPYAQQPQQQAAPMPDESDYPAVTALEQQVLGQTYAGQDITQRLGRLEMATYHSVQQGALVDRVDNLQMLVFGTTHPQLPQPNPAVTSTNYNANNNYNNGNDPQSDPNSGNGIATTPADMAAATTQVEKQVLRQTYPNDPEDVRLGRLETRLFNNTSPDMQPEDRLQRIIAVSAGGGENPGRAPNSPISMKSRAAGMLPVLLPIVLTVLFGLL